jgi:sugar lactone lactonase YvrE
MLRRLTWGAMALGATLLAPAGASAAALCPDAQPARTVLSGQGVLESVIADERGGLLYTDTSADALMRLDGPGAVPEQVAGGIDQPGGLLPEPGGTVLVGQGDGFVNGAFGNVIGLANLLRVNPATGAVSTFATGLSMANGLARGPGGEIYASDDAGTAIDRVAGGQVQRGWSSVISSNGLAVDSEGEHLFAAQTFQPAAIQRIDLSNPGNVVPYLTAAPADIAAGLDGITIDQDDRLFVAANGGGQVWRVNTDGSYCALATGLLLPSAVAFGSSSNATGFAATSLFAVTFSGSVIEMPGARELPRLTPAPQTNQAAAKKCKRKRGKRVKGKKRKKKCRGKGAKRR